MRPPRGLDRPLRGTTLGRRGAARGDSTGAGRPPEAIWTLRAGGEIPGPRMGAGGAPGSYGRLGSSALTRGQARERLPALHLLDEQGARLEARPALGAQRAQPVQDELEPG